MSSEYRVQYFSGDRKCWVDNDSNDLPIENHASYLNSWLSVYSAIGHLKHCAYSDPDIPHRLVKIETIALSANGETLIGSIG